MVQKSAKKTAYYFVNDLDIIISSLNVVIQGLCFTLKRDNPKFNSEKFKEACQPPQEVK